MLKLLGLAGMASAMLLTVSCTHVATTPAAQRFPAEKRVILENNVKDSDREILLASAHSRFGGFERKMK
jgi:hypothetical protein